MSTQVLIQGVEYDPAKRWWRIAQLVTSPDGSSQRVLHAIPDYAVVNHAAEYGLSPFDSQTVIDWLLHERFGRTPQDPNALCPYRNPPQIAWAAHQARIQEVKTRVSISDPDGHLGKIHAAHNPSWGQISAATDRAAATRAHVAHIERNRHLYG